MGIIASRNPHVQAMNGLHLYHTDFSNCCDREPNGSAERQILLSPVSSAVGRLQLSVEAVVLELSVGYLVLN
jgi:hypothetical protein